MSAVVSRVARAFALAMFGVVPACSALLDGEIRVVQCSVEGAYGPPACPETQTCVDGMCRDVGLPLGSPCMTETDCHAPATCVDLGMILGGPSDKRCTLPCCSSEDCGASSYGLVCRPIDVAAQALCWPASELPKAALPGAAEGGASCVSGSDCRSGACTGGRCVDACCRTSDCARAEDVCRLGETPLSSSKTWICGAPSVEATPTPSSACLLDSDCRSGACSVVIDGQRYCAEPCCSSKDCGEIESSALADTRYVLACSKMNGERACARVVPVTAVRGVGESCTDDDECRSGSCIEGPNGRYCSDLCCEDASCGDPERFACLPHSVGGSWALRCVRR
jgi:hypothetical protein